MIKNPACTPEQVARNLKQRESDTQTAMMKSFENWQADYFNAGTRELYINALEKWQAACEDVRQFKLQHPSAFVFEEVTE